MCDPCDVIRRHASAEPEPRDHTTGRSTISLLVHNMLVQTMQLYKAYRRLSRPPPRRKTGGASSPFSGGKKPRDGLPITERGHWIWWERKKLGTHPSSYPPPDPYAIPTSAATAPPWQMRGQHHEKHWWRLSPQRELSESKHTQWQTLTERAVSSLESWLCVLSSRPHTACNVICSRPSLAFKWLWGTNNTK